MINLNANNLIITDCTIPFANTLHCNLFLPKTQTTNVQNSTASFGMLMPGRGNTPAQSYRYGFNGQEKDDEVAGNGSINTAQFWEYDTRLGRRWNLDPEPQISISDYATFGNNPVLNSDVLGDTWDPNIFKTYKASDNNTYSYNFREVYRMTATKSAYNSLLNSSSLFKVLNNRIVASKTVYSMKGTSTYVTLINVNAGTAGPKYGDYSRNDEENKNLNTANLYGDAYSSAKQLKSTMFEEVFHAAQDDYYNTDNRASLSTEVEAKFAQEIENLDDTYGIMKNCSSIVDKFKSGKDLSNTELKSLQGVVDAVADTYGYKTIKVNKAFVDNTFKYLKSALKESKETTKKKETK